MRRGFVYLHFFALSVRIDGNLFVNLGEPEYADMGITNKFHIRKLQIIMKAYKARYAKKLSERRFGGEGSATGGGDGDDELESEYSPSELSDIIAHEGLLEDEDQDHSQVTVVRSCSIIVAL